MLLRELIERLDSLPEEATIFAALDGGHFTATSDATCLELSDEEHREPITSVAARRAPGKSYFLEVFVAREALDGWLEMRGEERLNPEEATSVVIYYAEHDAWPEGAG